MRCSIPLGEQKFSPKLDLNTEFHQIRVKPSKIHVLGDTLSRAKHAEGNEYEVNDIEVLLLVFDAFSAGYENDFESLPAREKVSVLDPYERSAYS